MSKIDRRKIQDTERFTVRDAKNQNIERVYIPHNTTVGAAGFKDADLTVLGDLYVCGSIIGADVSTEVPDVFAPYDAQYILQQSNSGLPQARQLIAGSNIYLADQGPANNVEVYAFPSGDGATKALQINTSGAFAYDSDLTLNTLDTVLLISGTVDSQNVPWICDNLAGPTSFRRRFNVFPWLPGGTGFLSWDLAFTSGYTGPQQFSFYEAAYDSNGNRYAHGAVQDTGNSISVGSADVSSTQPIFTVRNRPKMRGMIQMPTSSIGNFGVAIGFAPYSTSKLTLDRPQWPSIYGGTYYALIQYFSDAGSPITGSSTSLNGRLGQQTVRSSSRWHLISCGSSDTSQNANSFGSPAIVGGRYYFEIELDENSVSAKIEGNTSSGGTFSSSASNSVLIPSGTLLGWTVEASIFYVSPRTTDPRDFGVFGVQVEY